MREHEARPEHARRVRKPPRDRMEDRHHRERDVGAGEVHGVGEAEPERVQVRGAVRVDDLLRMPGRAARVAHRHRRVLVEIGPREVVRARSEEAFPRVLGRIARRDGRIVAADPPLDRGKPRTQRRDAIVELAVVEDDPVPRLADRPLEIGVGKPRIRRMDRRAETRHREGELEVAVLVPEKRAHAIAGPDARPHEARGEMPDTIADLRPRVADRAGGEGRDHARHGRDLGAAEDDRTKEKRMRSPLHGTRIRRRDRRFEPSAKGRGSSRLLRPRGSRCPRQSTAATAVEPTPPARCTSSASQFGSIKSIESIPSK